MNGSQSTILTIAVALLTLGSALGPVAAHESTGTDLNTLVLDDIWDTFGPSGPAEDEIEEGFETLGFPAERAGGDCTTSRSHEFNPTVDTGCTLPEGGTGGDTYTPTFYQCDGVDPAETDGIDLHVDANNPFFHSDLENGIFEATGSFLVDIELGGEDAEQVEEIWFIYFHTFPWPASKSLCQGPFPLPGAYVEFVTGDTNGADGWEIPVNTLTVPDMAYGAGIRAFDEQGNVLKTAFVYANVNNYLNDLDFRPGSPQECDRNDNDAVQCNYHDVTPPWPLVKGAEGKDLPAWYDDPDHSCDGVVFEYGEPLASPGEDLQDSIQTNAGWQEVPAEPKDAETVPLFTVQPEMEAFGPALCFSGVSGTLTVTATDQNGNTATRTVQVS